MKGRLPASNCSKDRNMDEQASRNFASEFCTELLEKSFPRAV
jgi:hypothetical protein